MTDIRQPTPLIPHFMFTEEGLLPIRKSPIRFAVGSPDGYTSNAWRVWSNKHGDVYIACRDNFNNTKVSLHASGRWRMGFTTEALTKNPEILSCNQNRAWEVWDQPPSSIPYTVTAFRLLFPTSELALTPAHRPPSKWANVIYIQAAPAGKLTAVTLFVTDGEVTLKHETEPSFCLASLEIGNGRYAQLIAHSDPEMDIHSIIDNGVTEARRQAESSGIKIPKGAYAYFFGRHKDGARFIVGSRMHRINGN